MKFGLGIVGGLLLAVAVANAHAAQQGRSIGGIGITVYEDVNYRGENATFLDDVPSLNRYGLSRRISSLRVGPGEYWEGCEEPNYRGRCQVFSNTESNLGRVGWNDRIQSLRRPRSGGGGGGGGGRPPTGEGGRLELFDKRNFGGKVFGAGVAIAVSRLDGGPIGEPASERTLADLRSARVPRQLPHPQR